jgi:hypothetical protein
MPAELTKVLKLTSLRYKKENYTEKEFHDFGTDHGLKAAKIQQRHGALRVAQVGFFNSNYFRIILIFSDWQYHTPSVTKKLLTDNIPFALRPGWAVDDHDIMISVWVRTTEQMAAIFMDPDFQTLVMGDTPESQEKAHITAGWEEVFLDDGKIVDVPFPPYEERSAVGAGSKKVSIEETPEETKL